MYQFSIVVWLQKGETSLHLAAELQKESVHREGEDVHIIKILMEYDADITAATREVWHKEQSDIMICIFVFVCQQ